MVEKTTTTRFQGLWPHSADQQLLHMLVSRLKAWRSLIEELERHGAAQQHLAIKSASEFVKLERRLASMHSVQQQQHQQQGSALSALIVGDGGNKMVESLVPLQNAFRRYNVAETDVWTGALRNLGEIKNEIIRKIKTIRTLVDSSNQTVTRERQNTIASIQLHERISARNMSSYRPSSTSSSSTAVSSPSGNTEGNGPVDPWLSERVLYKQLRTMIDAENHFQEKVVEILEDVKLFDAKIIAALNVALFEYVNARSGQYRTMIDELQRAETATRAVDATEVYRSFEDRHGLCRSLPAWSVERELFDFPYQIVEIGIVKQAVLRRHCASIFSLFGGGGGGSAHSNGGSGSWTPALFVVTESGYLHCFKKVPSKRRSGNGFLWGGSGGLAAEEEEEPAYQNLKKPKTQYSIMLKGRVTVEVAAEKSHEHVFVVKNTTVVGKNSRSTSYEIKAASESEMIDWVSCLRAKIESYIPDGPPTPLFSTAQVIDERVNEATTAQREMIINQKQPRASDIPTAPKDRLGHSNESEQTLGSPALSDTYLDVDQVEGMKKDTAPHPPLRQSTLMRRVE